MFPGAAALPEFDRFRRDAKGAEGRGQAKGTGCNAGFYFSKLELQRRATGGAVVLAHEDALDGGKCTQFFGFSGNDHLAVQGQPREEQTRGGIRGDLLDLARIHFGEENKTAFIVALQEDGPNHGDSLVCDGSQAHRERLRNSFLRVLEPIGKLRQRIRS